MKISSRLMLLTEGLGSSPLPQPRLGRRTRETVKYARSGVVGTNFIGENRLINSTLDGQSFTKGNVFDDQLLYQPPA